MMTTTPHATHPLGSPTHLVPSVWIGCLGCYNAGRLVGDWFPAINATETTIEHIHASAAITDCGSEELWVMDTDNLPVSQEMSLEQAQRWGELLDELGSEHGDVLRAWIASGTHIVDGQDMPCLEDFWERYCGTYDSWDDYVEHAAIEMDLLDHVPEHLRCYVDLTRWGRDLACDYAVEEDTDGGVHIFSCR